MNPSVIARSAEELEALPIGSIILNEDYQEVAIRSEATSGLLGWSVTGDGGFRQSWYLLHELPGPWTRLR